MNSHPNEKGRILIIEDSRTWADNFVEILRRIGEKREVDIYSPDEFLNNMTSPPQFENIDVCITDLELYGGDDTNAGDLAGLNDILPHVRKLAPWVPIACLSRYIQTGNLVLWELSVSDFDFFSPKGMIIIRDRQSEKSKAAEGKETRPRLKSHPDFGPEPWAQMLQKMQFKRIANITSRSLCDIKDSGSKSRTLTPDTTTTEMLSHLEITKKSLGEAIGLLGIEGSDFSIKALQPGFSGVNVSLVSAHGHTDDEPVHAAWLLKWGLPIWKLEEEANAHRRIFCRGIERSLQIPQLHPHAIVWDGIGYIAYAFEQDAQVALVVAKENIDVLSKSLCTITHGLYDEARRKTVLGVSELSKWVGLSTDEAQGLVTDNELFEISWSLLHGDLHLRNIFIRDNTPTLIDFARSDFGPIAIDAAKIIIDVLVCAPPDNLPKSLTEEDIVQSGLASILAAFKPYLKEKHDTKFLNVALRAIAHKYLSYSDVIKDAKAIARIENFMKQTE